MTNKKSSHIETITFVIKSGDPPLQIISTDHQRIRTQIRVNLPKAQ